MISNKKDDIIQATIRLFYEKGLQSTPMSAIAIEANVGMGTIYNYFPTKENLINELYLYLKEKQANYMLKDIDELQSTSVKIKLMSVLSRVIDYYFEFYKEALLQEQLALSPIISADTHTLGKEYFIEIFKIYIQGQKEDIIKNGNLQQLAYFTKGGLANICKFYLANQITMNEETRTIALQCAWDAVKK